MPRWTGVAGVLAAAACGKGAPARPATAGDDAAPAPAADGAPAATADCERLPFADTIDVPEASGAVLFADHGARRLLVVADSGNDGAYAIVDAETGAFVEDGRLPLGEGASADLEGLAIRGELVSAITSSGWVRTWRRGARGWKLLDGPYPVADPDDGVLACPGGAINCGPNYEGLCLAPPGGEPDGTCIGLAAAKQDGRLYCVVAAGARLAVTGDAIAVSAPETLTGCDVAPDGAVWAGTNLFGRSEVYRITGWREPATARVEPIANLGPGFPEAIVAGPDGVVYRYSDASGRPSLVAKFRCATPGR
jgi:hypothetical protein